MTRAAIRSSSTLKPVAPRALIASPIAPQQTCGTNSASTATEPAVQPRHDARSVPVLRKAAARGRAEFVEERQSGSEQSGAPAVARAKLWPRLGRATRG